MSIKFPNIINLMQYNYVLLICQPYAVSSCKYLSGKWSAQCAHYTTLGSKPINLKCLAMAPKPGVGDTNC